MDRPDRHGEACWVTWVWVLQIGAKAFTHSAVTKHDRDLAVILPINPQTQHGGNPTFTPGKRSLVVRWHKTEGTLAP